MATPDEIAARALRRLKVLGASETAAPEDLALALQRVTDAHNALDTQKLLRWTLNDIPQQVELAYEQMAAYLAADDFVQAKDAAWMAQGFTQVQSFVQIPVRGPIWSEDF